MSAPVCKYCGEPISKKGKGLSRHPDLCASCSSITDGMGEPTSTKASDLVQDHEVAAEQLEVREAA